MRKVISIIIAAGILVSASSVNAADSDWVFLHCAGSNQPIGKEPSGYAVNIYIKRDGSALSLSRNGDEFSPIPRVGTGVVLGSWRFADKVDDPTFLMYREFTPGNMSLSSVVEIHGKIASASRLACREISNPFMK